jgi:hypothetical protein
VSDLEKNVRDLSVESSPDEQEIFSFSSGVSTLSRTQNQN